MVFELLWPYIPVLVVGLFWAVAIRPILRLTHLSPFAVPRHAPRRHGGATQRRQSARR